MTIKSFIWEMRKKMSKKSILSQKNVDPYEKSESALFSLIKLK